jgi:lipoprotein-anchoring transpeptidase ErfK/SrfK
MKKISILVALVVTLFAAPAMASSVVARIDLSSQRMNVFVDGKQRYSWPVSTARSGYSTPVGTFRPQRLERMWYSRKYHMSPMPHSIFFLGGYAIHGTDAVGRLGRPASHGCVRLHPSNAATLYSLVRQSGSTQIVVTR